MLKHLFWGFIVLLTVGMVCGTVIYIHDTPWTLRFEVDETIGEVLLSVDWGDINIATEKIANMSDYNITLDGLMEEYLG